VGEGDRVIRRVVQVDQPGVRRWAERVRAHFPDAQIRLFGSRARGEASIQSDYDFCVVSRGFEGMKPWDRSEAVVALWDLPAPIEVVAYTPAEWERMSDWTFIRTVREQGRLISGVPDGSPGGP
jgi:uncharacterized protein